MPPKKAGSKSAGSSTSSPDMEMIWKWVYVVATVVAAVLGGLAALKIFTSPDILTWLLLLVAVILGWFYFDPEEIGQFGLRVVILFVAQAGLSAVPWGVGTFLTGFFGGWVGFLFPIVLAMAIHFFWVKRIATLF